MVFEISIKFKFRFASHRLEGLYCSCRGPRLESQHSYQVAHKHTTCNSSSKRPDTLWPPGDLHVTMQAQTQAQTHKQIFRFEYQPQDTSLDECKYSKLQNISGPKHFKAEMLNLYIDFNIAIFILGSMSNSNRQIMIKSKRC